MTSDKDVVTIAKDYYSSWNQAWKDGDFQTPAAFVSEDCRFVCGQGKLRVGRDGFLQLVAEARPVMTIENEIDRITADGNTVTAEYVSRLVLTDEARRDHPEAPPTFQVRHVDVMEFEDGKIVGGRTYNNVSEDDVAGHIGPPDMTPLGNFGYTGFSDQELKQNIVTVQARTLFDLL